MKRALAPFTLICLFLLFVPHGGYPQNVFQDAIDAIRGDTGVRGMSVTVIEPDGAMMSAASNMPGKANPVDTGMLFGVGSMTKTYIEYCLLRLMEEGGPIMLHGTIGEWLYDGVNPPLPASFKEIIGPDITVGQLMNHTSGVYDYQVNPLYFAAVYLDKNKIWEPLEILRFVGSPSFSPGSRYEYSNTNYILLGMILERVAAADALSVFRDEIVYPYNFTSTFMKCLEPVIGVTAVGYEKNMYGNYYTTRTLLGSGNSMYSSSWTCGNVVTTSGELARWAGIYFARQEEGGYLDGGAYHAYWNPADNDELEGICPECTRDYGLCMMKFDFSPAIPGCVVYGHTGSIPGYNGFLMHWPAKNISVAVLMNDHSAPRYKVLMELLEYLNTVY